MQFFYTNLLMEYDECFCAYKHNYNYRLMYVCINADGLNMTFGSSTTADFLEVRDIWKQYNIHFRAGMLV